MTDEEQRIVDAVTAKLTNELQVGDRCTYVGHAVTIVGITRTSAWPPCYEFRYEETGHTGITTLVSLLLRV